MCYLLLAEPEVLQQNKHIHFSVTLFFIKIKVMNLIKKSDMFQLYVSGKATKEE